MKNKEKETREEEIDPYEHVPDGDNIEPYGLHPWSRFFFGKGRNKGGGKKGAHYQWKEDRRLQQEGVAAWFLAHGELPTGRHRWQSTKGRGKGGKAWTFHMLYQNRAEDEQVGPEWQGGYIADYAVAARARSHSAPPKPSRPTPGSSGNLADYYRGPLPSVEPAEYTMPEELSGRWLKRGGQENGVLWVFMLTTNMPI